MLNTSGSLLQTRDAGNRHMWTRFCRSLFEGATDEIAIGEASVCYLWSLGAARNNAARLPNAQIVVLLEASGRARMVTVSARRPNGYVEKSFRDRIEACLRSAAIRRILASCVGAARNEKSWIIGPDNFPPEAANALHKKRLRKDLALATVPAAAGLSIPGIARAAQSSKIDGVQIGAITYSFRLGVAKTELPAVMQKIGLSEVELMSGDAETIAGIPSSGGGETAGGGGRAGDFGPGSRCRIRRRARRQRCAGCHGSKADVRRTPPPVSIPSPSPVRLRRGAAAAVARPLADSRTGSCAESGCRLENGGQRVHVEGCSQEVR